jgi:hypothetical protein
MRGGKLIAALVMFLGICAFTNRASACYDPSLGRWLQQDPAGYKGGTDLFLAYKDNPVDRVDPDGRLGYRTSVAPVSGLCYLVSDWIIDWTGIPRGFSGWIIQRIDYDQGLTACDTGKPYPPDQSYQYPYWEGFQVTNGEAEDSDTWGFINLFGVSHGVEGKRGSAQLYSSSLTELPNPPFEKSAKNEPPGGLYVSFEDPALILTGHGFAPFGSPVNRTEAKIWNCCCGKRDYGTLYYR